MLFIEYFFIFEKVTYYTQQPKGAQFVKCTKQHGQYILLTTHFISFLFHFIDFIFSESRAHSGALRGSSWENLGSMVLVSTGRGATRSQGAHTF